MRLILLTILTFVPLIAVGVYAPIPEREQGQLLSVQLETGIGYDDNLFGSPSNEFSSFVYTADATLGTNLSLGKQGFFSAKYGVEGQFYEERPTDDELFNHQLDGKFSYSFSERFTLTISDQLRSIDNPESSLVLGSADLQADQSYWDNRFEIEGLWSFSEKAGLVFRSAFYGVNYDNIVLARLIDLRRREFTVSGRYALLPETTLISEVRLQEIIYDVDDPSKGSDSVFVLVGANYSMSEKFVLQGRVGVESRNRNFGEDKESFTGSLTGVFSYQENSAITFGLNNQIREASNTNTFIDSEVSGLFVSIQHDLTGSDRLYVSGLYMYEHIDLNARPGELDVSDKATRFGLSLTYKIKENLRLIGSYDYDDIRSDDFFRSQRRNRVALSVQYQFGGIQ